MAATLLEIKSKLLVPNNATPSDMQIEMEELDPRAELVRRLVEYKKYKDISIELRLFEIMQSKIYYKPREDLTDYEGDEIEFEGLNIDKLFKSLSNIIEKRSKIDKVLDINEIQREEYTLESCIQDIKIKLFEKNKLTFSSLLKDDSTKKEIITFFLSILELIRMKYINVIQKEDFSDLIIRKRIVEGK